MKKPLRFGRLFGRSMPNEGGKKAISCIIKPNLKTRPKNNRVENKETRQDL